MAEQEGSRTTWAVTAASAGTSRVIIAAVSLGIVVFVLLRRRGRHV